MYIRLKPLLSLPFLLCLMLLMANDFLLKPAFHNIFTGKLSDFCGLFIFPLFWSALFPKRKLWIFIFTGLLFIYWKSNYSSAFIEFFSTHIFSIQRVVDPTDLIALLVLPLAWYGYKKDLEIHILNPFLRQISPYFIAVITFFSFCATSQPRYVQSFNQPQYVLLKSDVMPDSNSYGSDFKVYKFDSLLAVEVYQIFTSSRAARNDDYNKNLMVKNLEREVFNTLSGHKSLMTPGRITLLTVKTPYYEDWLRFSGGRLDGKFIRKSGDKVVIEGVYKNGIEDSIWTFRDTSSNVVTKKTFINGERTREEEFKASINTRADAIRIKYIQIGVLTLLMIGMGVLLVKNYRTTYPERLKMKTVWKWLLCLLLPVMVFLIQLGITLLLSDYNRDIFEMLGMMFLIYIITFPLFIIAFFGIKLRKGIDILWYCLLFALAYSIFVECVILNSLYS
jgi:hypothetical protein